MGLFLGSLAWLAGAVIFTLSFQRLRKANPQEKIPQFFGRPTHHPGKIYALRAAAAALLMLSAFAWSETLGYWAVGLIFLAAIPALVLNRQHNRAVGVNDRR